jgi:hypothetical protein
MVIAAQDIKPIEECDGVVIFNVPAPDKCAVCDEFIYSEPYKFALDVVAMGTHIEPSADWDENSDIFIIDATQPDHMSEKQRQGMNNLLTTCIETPPWNAVCFHQQQQCNSMIDCECVHISLEFATVVARNAKGVIKEHVCNKKESPGNPP